MTDTELLAERYGRAATRRLDRIVLWAGGVAVGIAVVAWVVWAGLANPGATMQVDDLGIRIHDEHLIDIKYQVSTAPGTDVRCALQVLNATKATVGWRIVDLPPSDQHTRVFTDSVRTTELGVAGLIYRCWVP